MFRTPLESKNIIVMVVTIQMMMRAHRPIRCVLDVCISYIIADFHCKSMAERCKLQEEAEEIYILDSEVIST